MARWSRAGVALLIAVPLVALAAGTVLREVRPATAAGTWWHPGPLRSWQDAIGEALPIAVPTNVGDVAVYDIDEGNQAGVTSGEVAASVAAVHTSGAKAICYVDTGGWESYRADASELSSAILGLAVAGYPNERYVDIRQWSGSPGPTGMALGQLLTARFQLCRAEGFDGVETDLDDTYADNTGFPLTMADGITFMTEMAGAIHGLGLAWFMKNGINGDSLISDMEPLADGTVNEQCWQYGECSALEPFVQAAKPVLNVEYADEAETTVCPEALAFPMATLHAGVDLGGTIAWACWQYGNATGTTTARSTTSEATTTTTTPTRATVGGGPAPTPTTASTTSVGTVPMSTTLPVGPRPRAPAFTSPSRVTATVGHRFRFQVGASGNPLPALAHSALPSGLVWTGHGRGKATISGVPGARAAGLTRVLLSAVNPGGHAHQVLTIQAQRRPGFTSGAPPAATVGRRYHFVFSAYGYPVPTVRERGTLPVGLAFVRNHNGRATLSGRPAPGSAGGHRMTVTLSNSLGTMTVHYVLVVVPR
jgi:hypothetical protein